MNKKEENSAVNDACLVFYELKVAVWKEPGGGRLRGVTPSSVPRIVLFFSYINRIVFFCQNSKQRVSKNEVVNLFRLQYSQNE